jgi:hypothetical protein
MRLNRSTLLIWILAIISLGIFYTWVFTRPFESLENLKNGGPIGEAINGLTAPLIGIVGAILIYVSFREQVRANRIQTRALNEQRELDLFYRFYEELKNRPSANSR